MKQKVAWLIGSVVQHVIRSFVDVIFFFNDTATTEIYTLSLHDALPIQGLNNTFFVTGKVNLKDLSRKKIEPATEFTQTKKIGRAHV